jgi:O-antigen/teichoic acid export membrane protein
MTEKGVADGMKRSAVVGSVGRYVSREHVFAFVDQAIVSAVGFLTTLIIAHWSDSSELGVYALGLSVLLSVVAFQDSLILQPYTIQRHYHEGTAAERAGASLTLSVLFSIANVLALACVAIALIWRASSATTRITFAIAAIMPFALTRDFARRYDFAHLATGRAAALDLTAAVVQLCVLAWLGLNGRMSATGAYAAIGAGCALPTAIWLYNLRGAFKFSRWHVLATLKQTWALGKWLLAGRVTGSVQWYVSYWLAAIIGGTAIAGVYAACMSIVGFANPLIIGLANVWMPKSILAWKHGGGPMLLREALRNTTVVAALMMIFSVAVFLGGERAMELLYRASDFSGHGQTLVVLAVAISLGTLGTPAAIALAVMERPRAIIIVMAAEALVTFGLVWVLMSHFGLLGAAYGMLAGNMGGALGRWAAFYVIVPKLYDPAPPVGVLREFTSSEGESRWTVAEHFS